MLLQRWWDTTQVTGLLTSTFVLPSAFTTNVGLEKCNIFFTFRSGFWTLRKKMAGFWILSSFRPKEFLREKSPETPLTYMVLTSWLAGGSQQARDDAVPPQDGADLSHDRQTTTSLGSEHSLGPSTYSTLSRITETNPPKSAWPIKVHTISNRQTHHIKVFYTSQKTLEISQVREVRKTRVADDAKAQAKAKVCMWCWI